MTEGETRFFDRPYAVLALLTLIYVCNSMDRHVIALLAEPIRTDLNLSDTQLGLLSGLMFAFFYTVFGVPVGWLADRLGRVKVITIACFAWSICSAAGALSANFVQLALARVGVAIGEAGGSAPSYSLITAKFPARARGHAIGLFHLASPVSTLIGVALCGWIASHYGWRAAVAAVSLPGIVFALLLFTLVKEPVQGDTAMPSLLHSIRDFFKDPVLRLAALTAGLASFGTHAMAAWIPAFLMRVKGISLQEMGMYYGVTSAASFGFGLWFGGWLADRFTAYNPRAYALVPAICLLLAMPLIPLAVMAESWLASMVLWMLPVALAATFLAPAVTLIQNVAPALQRSVFGAIYLLANNLVGLGAGPLYVGIVSDRLEPVHGPWALGMGMLAIIPVLALGSAGQFWLACRIGKRAI